MLAVNAELKIAVGVFVLVKGYKFVPPVNPRIIHFGVGPKG